MRKYINLINTQGCRGHLLRFFYLALPVNSLSRTRVTAIPSGSSGLTTGLGTIDRGGRLLYTWRPERGHARRDCTATGRFRQRRQTGGSQHGTIGSTV